MAFEKRIWTGADLDNVLSEYPKAETMPESITEVPGFMQIESPRERDEFEQRFMREESTRYYKSIDSKSGIVYLIKNPLCWDTISHGDGRCTRIRPYPRKMGTVAELLSANVAGTPSEKPKRSKWNY
jgi:hypothetical protein